MIGMKVRYEITAVNLKISNVNPREAQEGYVLLTASDDNDNELVFALSHQQAEYLEGELHETNRRWRMTAAQQANKPANQAAHGPVEDPFTPTDAGFAQADGPFARNDDTYAH
ncbi:hypothetical protein [Paenibacillus xerothermodurans]|uniref:Uncharacterized protein n=1 Tax=Paenibacillus xerothermodurans TaxID=1977292 RepID=A0A2W1P4E0_PAEXE|nr:hypothetical protein [Paenibacillus xerothermodurans]PZE22592.1 hypothetical protein CBW46_002110 [Paenibacillus xerothermodurans]